MGGGSYDSEAQRDAKSGAQIIRPPHDLKKRVVRPGNASLAALEAISRAESAIEELSVNFGDWMQAEVERLAIARGRLKSEGAAVALEAVFQAAHDLKGQATTLGYPLAAEVCASLCRLIDVHEDKSRVPATLVNHHVDAVRAMVREAAAGDENETARRLTTRLRQVTDEIVARREAERTPPAAA